MPKPQATAHSKSAELETSFRYHGWRVVIACFATAICAWGAGFYGHSVFIAHLRAEHGWSPTLVSSATTMYFLAGAVLVAFVDDAMRQFGPRAVLLTGLMALAASTVLLVHIDSVWQLYAAYLLMAVGWAGAALGAIVNVLGLWFDKRRGMAISQALHGASAGGILFSVVLLALADRVGFDVALYLIVTTVFAIAISLVCLWVDRNPDMPLSSASSRPLFARGEKWAVLSSASFWSIALPFALGVAVQVGVIAHLVSVLEPRMGRADAGSAVALVSVSAFVGRFAFSFVIDRLAPRSATSILLFVQAVSLGALSITESPALIYIACIGFGIGVGNLITLPAIVIQRECEAAHFSLVSGLVTATMGFAWALTPVMIGLLRDVSGDYRDPLLIVCAMDVMAALLAFWRPNRRRAEP